MCGAEPLPPSPIFTLLTAAASRPPHIFYQECLWPDVWACIGCRRSVLCISMCTTALTRESWVPRGIDVSTRYAAAAHQLGVGGRGGGTPVRAGQGRERGGGSSAAEAGRPPPALRPPSESGASAALRYRSATVVAAAHGQGCPALTPTHLGAHAVLPFLKFSIEGVVVMQAGGRSGWIVRVDSAPSRAGRRRRGAARGP